MSTELEKSRWSSGTSWTGSIGQAWQSALESLLQHKLRAGLTLLTVVVGVAALLTLNVLGRLTEQAVARNFGALGATLVSISPQAPLPPAGAGGVARFDSGTPGGESSVPPPELDQTDLQALSSLPHVAAAALHASMPPVRVVANGQNGTSRLLAATPKIQTVLGYTVAAGAFYTDQDDAGRANVGVLGATVAACC